MGGKRNERRRLNHPISYGRLCGAGRHWRAYRKAARQVVLVLVCCVFPDHSSFRLDLDAHEDKRRFDAVKRKYVKATETN